MVRDNLMLKMKYQKYESMSSLLKDDIGQRIDVGAEKYGMQVPIEDSDDAEDLIFTQEAYEELCDIGAEKYGKLLLH